MSAVKQMEKNWRVSIFCATAFSLLCVFVAFLGHGMVHNYPIIAMIFYWFMYPSVIIIEISDKLFQSGVSNTYRLVTVVVIQFIISIIICRFILFIKTKAYRLR